MAKYLFPAIFKKEDNGQYSVNFPDIPQCYTCGDNLQDAFDAAQDVLCMRCLLYTSHFIGEGRPRTGTPNSGGSQTLLSRFLSPPISPTFRGYAALRRRVLPKTRIAAPSPGYGGVNPLFSLLGSLWEERQ